MDCTKYRQLYKHAADQEALREKAYHTALNNTSRLNMFGTAEADPAALDRLHKGQKPLPANASTAQRAQWMRERAAMDSGWYAGQRALNDENNQALSEVGHVVANTADGATLGLIPNFQQAAENELNEYVRAGGTDPEVLQAVGIGANLAGSTLGWGAIGKGFSLLGNVPRMATAANYMAKGVYTFPVLSTIQRAADLASRTDTLRYTAFGARDQLEDAAVYKYQELRDNGASIGEAGKQVAAPISQDIARIAAEKYPDDPEKQREYYNEHIAPFIEARTPGFTPDNLPGVEHTPAHITALRNEQQENKPVGQRLVQNIKDFFSSKAEIGARVVKDPNADKVMIPMLTNELRSRMTGGKTNGELSADSKAVLQSYFGTAAQDPKRFKNILDKLSTGVPAGMDFDALHKVVEFAQSGKMNWEDIGLTPAQGKMVTQAFETGFKNRALTLWKEDPFKYTPDLISLWARNSGLPGGFANVIRNPIVFYGGGLLALLGIGGALDNAFQRDSGGTARAAAGQGVVRSPYDEGYTQFAPVRVG